MSITLSCFRRATGSRPRLPLFSGRGEAPNYSWHEEAFEIEVSVVVPKSTRPKDLRFKATLNSIELNLLKDDGRDSVVLLDPSRPLRGKICVEGTYWVLGDVAKNEGVRKVTVTIEKLLSTPRDDFDIVTYDWKGVYQQDVEVIERVYDAPEKLDVRQYAASLGIDIDNLNMSMVDKTMFTSGMNITHSSLDQLTKAGLVKEVTSQQNGDFTVDTNGKVSRYDTFGPGSDEDLQISRHSNLPFLDYSPSAWKSALSVKRDPETNQTFVQQTRNLTRAGFAQDASTINILSKIGGAESKATDPIDLLTINRLKEILKSQGLKVTGSKKELQNRLRTKVNSLLQGKPE